VGQTVQFSATAYDDKNNVLTGRVFSWSSSDQSRATITSSGLATAIKSGSVTIKATSGGKTGSATLSVN
jgi:uncharacterized protein YjdB